jgi:ABC-type multidrug transport system fused ATPase/permease subunit
MKMDRIIVLEQGIIIEEGNHIDLLNKQGRYAEMWKHQKGGFLGE